MRESGRSVLLTSRITGQLGREGLAEDEAGLGQRALGRVDEEDDAVDHGQAALHLAAEVGVAGGVDDVDGDGLALGGRAVVDTVVFLARMVMPFSRSRSPESMTRSATSPCAANELVCLSMASTRVVFPWSTWATMATLRRSLRTAVLPVVSDMRYYSIQW